MTLWGWSDEIHEKWVVKTQRKNEEERIVFSSYDRLNASIEAKRDIIAYENGIFGWGIY